jgi:YidC/Oxa1 family membrane protein insertase
MDFLYQAFGFVLFQIYQMVQNYGFAIILFTILVKCVLLPLNLKQTRSTKEMQAIQPEIQKLQSKYKNNPDKLNQETVKLYKLYKINPMAGCLPLVIQLPIIYGLFGALKDPAQWVFTNVDASAMSSSFYWIPNLGSPDPYYVLPILCVLLTFATQKYMMKFMVNGDKSTMQSQKMMLYIMPVFIGWAAISMPAGVSLYWVVQSIFTFVQQYFSMRKPVKLVPAEEAERRLEESKTQAKKEKKEKLKQQSAMREEAMKGQMGTASNSQDKGEKKKSTRPKTAPASSKKVQRRVITKIPERKDDDQ